jgi:hypothetical protein
MIKIIIKRIPSPTAISKSHNFYLVSNLSIIFNIILIYYLY